MAVDKKGYQGAPFGVQSERFNVSGVHPKFKPPGTYTEMPYDRKATSAKSRELGPGKYHKNEHCRDSFSAAAVQERASGPGWARAYEVSRMAALPHLLYKEQWELKREQKRKLGPGSYEYKDFLEVRNEKPRSTNGYIDTKDVRFKDSKKFYTNIQASKYFLTPGPGTYGKGGVPQAVLEEKDQISASTIGMLDSRAVNRDLPTVGSKLGPGTYNFQSSIDQLMNKKVTSVRGPYDLFTGDRNKPIKTGHYVVSNDVNMGPGKYEIKTLTDELKSEHSRKKGKLGKLAQYPVKPTERMCVVTNSFYPKNAADPGPGQYDPKDFLAKPLQQAQNSPPFHTSAARSDKLSTKFFTGNHNPVGAGRYDMQKMEDAQHRNGHSSAFKSVTNRPDHTKNLIWHERIRAKDVRKEDKRFLVQPEHPNQHMMRCKTYMEQNKVHPEFASHTSAPQPVY